MFESAELGHRVAKSDYERRAPKLREALLAAQLRAIDRVAEFPIVLLVGGVEGGGKGDVVNLLLEWMDARHIHVHAMGIRLSLVHAFQSQRTASKQDYADAREPPAPRRRRWKGVLRAIINASAMFAYGTVGNQERVLANFDVPTLASEIMLEAVA